MAVCEQNVVYAWLLTVHGHTGAMLTPYSDAHCMSYQPPPYSLMSHGREWRLDSQLDACYAFLHTALHANQLNPC